MHSVLDKRVTVVEIDELVPVEYGNGVALLRREPCVDRFWLSDAGRRALAEEALFGPWPTVAEAQL